MTDQKIVWDIDGNEWAIVGDVAYLNLSLNGVRVPYVQSNFFDSYADFVRARKSFEKGRDEH